MQAHGQTVACGVDLRQHDIELIALVANKVKNRPKHFALEFSNAVYFNQSGQHERSFTQGMAAAALRPVNPMHPMAPRLHRLDVMLNALLCLSINHRAHIGLQLCGAAHAQLSHCAQQHVQHAVGCIFLNAQHA